MPMHTKERVKSLSKSHAKPEQAKAYLHGLIDFITPTEEWAKHEDVELQEYLDMGFNSVAIIIPKAFEDFVNSWYDAHRIGINAGFSEAVDVRVLRTLARSLLASSTRRKFYLDFLRARIRAVDKGYDYKLPTVYELEARYQFYLYQKDRDEVNIKVEDGEFKDWYKSGQCITFYDVLELAPDFII